MVGKLGEAYDIANELYASKVLSEVTNSKEYFALADNNNVCKYNNLAETRAKTKDINECKIECETIRKEGASQTIYYSMPFGGISINKYFGGIIKGAAVAKRDPIHPRVIITHLLEACATMTLNNIVHYDIHTGNILFDEKTQLPRLIDFGMSFSADAIDKEMITNSWKIYSPTHPTEPPEITILTRLRKNGISFNTVFQEVLNGKAPLKKGQALMNLPLNLQRKTFLEFWNKSQSIKKDDVVSFFKFYWPGFDAWSVGVVIQNLLVNFALNSVYSKEADWKSTEVAIVELLRGLLQMSPSRRIDCVEALAMFSPENRVLLSASGKAWLQGKAKMRI